MRLKPNLILKIDLLYASLIAKKQKDPGGFLSFKGTSVSG